ncbi:unnamed protein product [Ambrosiozyma monospora]|uniref:Unnamed protein product n=1 Tax=Ambrosiozyma monospora TaxID=43982 RepID=A0A9W7DFF3_AMBMO|nr:unnamed protein product [Ambrosiozyma monospora]
MSDQKHSRSRSQSQSLALTQPRSLTVPTSLRHPSFSSAPSTPVTSKTLTNPIALGSSTTATTNTPIPSTSSGTTATSSSSKPLTLTTINAANSPSIPRSPTIPSAPGAGVTNKNTQVSTRSQKLDVSKRLLEETMVKLTAVGLKEASSDSPSFRTYINYADSAIVEISTSFIDIIQYFKNHHAVSVKLANLADDYNAIFKPLLQDERPSTAMLNKNIAKPCLDDSITSANVLFETLINLMTVDMSQIKKMETLIAIDFKDYFEWKKQFEATQEKYDVYLQKFLSLPKAHPANKTKEDAFQLFEIRKQYLYLSFTLYTVIEKLKVKISSTIVEACNSFWVKSNSPKVSELLSVLGLGKIQKNLQRLKYFSSITSNPKSLINDLMKTRQELEERASKLIQPSSDLKYYSPALLNKSNVYDTDDDMASLYEKHGWVYIKSTRQGSKDIFWARRWLFVKDDVFGFLTVAPNGMYVQESDKTGVLLGNFRYLPEEDRKFCFEIKTYQSSLTIQVETLRELPMLMVPKVKFFKWLTDKSLLLNSI